MTPLTYALLAFAIVGNATANILIKAGAQKIGATQNTGEFIVRAATSPLLIFGAGLFVIVLLAYSAVLTKLPLSVGYPIMTSLGFLIVVIASAKLFGESIRLPQIMGMCLILIGLWLVARYVPDR